MGDSHSSFDSLVLAADGAMYQAKHQGRGCYVVANTPSPCF
ncbi:MAG: hypothetical protein PHT20_06265 [Rhodoferax sp.]|nr:hypothetical protein [Rhodoferax sp.]